MPPSNLNLALMNLFVGMCKGVAGVPRTLRNLDYVGKAIEFGFANAAQEQVVPELIVASRRLNHTILFEWKDGQNTNADQLRRYAGVTTQDLRERAFLQPEEIGRHDVVVIGRQEFAERLAMGIDQGHHTFPLLLVSDDGIAIDRNRFVPNETDAVFRPRLDIDWGSVPNYFFPLDIDSELWEFAELMIPKVLEVMGNGEARILLRHLEETILCWGMLSRDYQARLKRKMIDMMNEASRKQFAPYFRPNREHRAQQQFGGQFWDITSNPISTSSDKRNREWKRMGTLYKQFVQFMRTGEELPVQEMLNLQPPAEPQP